MCHMHFDDSLRALVELAASRHNTFSSSEAAERDIPAQRLRRLELRGDLRRLHPRVWEFTALPSSEEQRVLAAILSLPGSAATTTTAAWLHGWQPQPPIPQLWYPKPESRNHPVADIRRWRRIDPTLDIVSVDQIQTLNKAATLCSLGPHVDTSVLEQCLDDYLRTDSERWLLETMERLDGRKPSGVRAIRLLLDDPRRVDGVTDSWFERIVAQLVALPWLPPIELQHQVSTATGNYRLDVACPELMLGVEAHSRSFHWGPSKADADNVRDLALGAEGWHILYVTWSQVHRPDEFVRQFAATARARAALVGIDLPAA